MTTDSRLCRAAALIVVAVAACAPADDGAQIADDSFPIPDTGPPTWPADEGPRVAIDEAHHNFHTVDGRYRTFAELLRRDGYRVGANTTTFSAEDLAQIDVLVISNALSAENEEEWSLPNHPAFEEGEVGAVRDWIENGGALLLIADHMPMPGAAADLGRALGLLFHDGYAYREDGVSWMSFSREDGTLADHPVVRAEGGGAVPFFHTFTGQAFRFAPGADGTPLLKLPAGAYMLLPVVYSERDETTPRIPADGMMQGVLLERGAGRAAVFGEAAAFSAQVSVRDGESFPMGMNHPDAPHNARLLLNVMRWLTQRPEVEPIAP